MELKENYSLKSLNTFGLDVKTRWFTEVTDLSNLHEIILDPRFREMKKMILGGGSNVLFTDDFHGLIIRNCIEGIEEISKNDSEVVIKAGAGLNWHTFVLYTIENNFPGIENLSLIPGSVGAAPIQNIGAYGVELKNTLIELEAMNLSDGSMRKFMADECKFGYRDSIFKREAKNKFAITSVTFRFNKNAKLNTSYGAIEEELKTKHITNPTIRDVSNAVIAIRQSKLPDPNVIGNAGSFFKNPEIPLEQFNDLKEKYSGISGYTAANNKMKIAAGWLIEQCGWKGKRIGETGMHAKQALVLVNYGHASGMELITHAKHVMESVNEKFGVDLEMEVNVI
jgi:UDP-N-acetylmuramate dehydrogenase